LAPRRLAGLCAAVRIVFAKRHQHDDVALRLLRTRGEGPRYRGTAEQRD
jgi:hypothetical protein